ncbi:MAG: creatininase family protein [Streptosporangiales bacterium]|nr:creatininase family protein [Streptosporangiales bacterium]MBO0891227.1 creatininase family protein [Acidothermales bacterium]
MTAALSDLTGPDVAAALTRNPIVVLPFGSIEQHGPHLPCGTDTMAADLVAREVAARLDALLVPFGPYGVTPIHAGHPGTISLSRRTFEALAHDVCHEVIRMGARALVLVNWHEGNTASLAAVATDLQDRLGATFVVAQACYVARRLYAEDGGELTHGGGIETLAVMAYDPALLRLDRAGQPSRPAGAAELDDMRRSDEVYGFVTDVTELAEDGWYGDPGWATPSRADGFAAKVAAEVVRQVERVLKGGRA